MDTGYPALIPEPLHNHNGMRHSTVPFTLDPQNPQGTPTQPEPNSPRSPSEKPA